MEQSFQPLKVVAVDISRDAVELTKKNAERNKVAERLSVLNMSNMEASEYFTEGDIKFDCVVSNPPYLTSREMTALQPEIHQYMDKRALHGGTDLAVEILSTCRHYLQPHGRVWLEMGCSHLDHIHSLLRLNPQWDLVYECHYRDFNQRMRFHQLKMM